MKRNVTLGFMINGIGESEKVELRNEVNGIGWKSLRAEKLKGERYEEMRREIGVGE